MGFSDQTFLPGLPATLVKSSALGGGLVAFFLGNGAFNSPTPEFAFLHMHPFAVSGFVGLLANAMALLPLGRKYARLLISSRMLSFHSLEHLSRRH